MKLSKSHEREELRLLKKGQLHCWIGLLLCGVPLLGILFSVSGYLRIQVRVTKKHRTRRNFALVLAVIMMCICFSVQAAELYIYSRDPGIIERGATAVWTFIVGEENVRKDEPAPEGDEWGEWADPDMFSEEEWDQGDWNPEDWTEEAESTPEPTVEPAQSAEPEPADEQKEQGSITIGGEPIIPPTR